MRARYRPCRKEDGKRNSVSSNTVLILITVEIEFCIWKSLMYYMYYILTK